MVRSRMVTNRWRSLWYIAIADRANSGEGCSKTGSPTWHDHYADGFKGFSFEHINSPASTTNVETKISIKSL